MDCFRHMPLVTCTVSFSENNIFPATMIQDDGYCVAMSAGRADATYRARVVGFVWAPSPRRADLGVSAMPWQRLLVILRWTMIGIKSWWLGLSFNRRQYFSHLVHITTWARRVHVPASPKSGGGRTLITFGRGVEGIPKRVC
jgi:hypothetical protein